MTPDRAIETVDRYIADAKEHMRQVQQLALERIYHLRWWQVGKAQQLAGKALGWGPYWRHDGRPKTFLGFWMKRVWGDVAAWWRRK
jgi:hypothetical protein